VPFYYNLPCGILRGTPQKSIKVDGRKMSYLALYRKYRPATFDSVKGQDHIVTTLKNQLRTGRIGHAYLFCGTRGTGKTSVAKLLAKAVNCENPTENGPCGECRICKEIENGNFMNVIEIDAASNNGVDSIRQIVEEVRYAPSDGKYRVYIIDEVHMLSTGAFNALLKTLEEPPSYVIFILATTEVHKIPITILSRCQRFDFRRIGTDIIAANLKSILDSEGIEADDDAIAHIARAGDGSMRDAESLLDRCIAFYMGERLTADKVLEVFGGLDNETYACLFRDTVKGDVRGVLTTFGEAASQGKDPARFVAEFTTYIRNVLIAKTVTAPENILEYSSEQIALLKNEASNFTIETLTRYIRVLSELTAQLRYTDQKRVVTEVALIKMCIPKTEEDLDSLKERIRVLEEKVEELSVNGVVRKEEPEEETAEVQAGPTVAALTPTLAQIGSVWNTIIDTKFGPIINAELRGVCAVPGENGRVVLTFKERPAPDGSPDIVHDPQLGRAFFDKLCSIVKGRIKDVLKVDADVVFSVKNEKEYRQSRKCDLKELVAKGVEIVKSDDGDAVPKPQANLLADIAPGLPIVKSEDEEPKAAPIPEYGGPDEEPIPEYSGPDEEPIPEYSGPDEEDDYEDEKSDSDSDDMDDYEL